MHMCKRQVLKDQVAPFSDFHYYFFFFFFLIIIDPSVR